MYWLQTECPRDDGGFGYPEFKFRKDIMGSRNGLSRQPYIRESRRIKSLETICAQDISQRPLGARARSFNNSVGLGWYSMDLHRSGEGEDLSMFKATSPFQIPLGSLIPIDTKNLIAACKNIGTTHLTNGAYRVHPVEWSIGEAAGQLAAFCLTEKRKPHQVWQDEKLTRTLQKRRH